MTYPSTRRLATITADFKRDVPRSAACPLCHTPAPTLRLASADAGGDWRCARCGQLWNAGRIATVAAYEQVARDRDELRNAPPTRRQVVPLLIESETATNGRRRQRQRSISSWENEGGSSCTPGASARLSQHV